MRAPTHSPARGSIPARSLLLAASLLLLATAGSTPADAAQPLGITSFSIEPTERTVERVSGFEHEFINEPYKTPFTQAGGHPWALTTRFAFTTEEIESSEKTRITVPTRDPKDIVTGLPPGLLGDPMAVPTCSLTIVTGGAEQCPADTQIGAWRAHLQGGHELLGPIVNVTPEAGQSAEFALLNTVRIQTPLLTAHLVRTSQGYGFTVASIDLPAIALESVEVTFWGVPADHSHDPMRGLFCRRPSKTDPLDCEGGGERSGLAPAPFVTMPADCAAGAETAVLRVDSWEEPGSVREGAYTGFAERTATLPAATGCDLLRFSAEIEVRPETLLADEPTGLDVNLKVPLSETPGSPATPQLRDSSVTLPEGVSVSPGVVDGIQACNEFGPEGINITGPESEQIGPSGELQLAPGHCPNASTVGTAEAITPFLPIPIQGHVYLARPACGGGGQRPCTERDAADGSLYRLYLELGGEGALARTGIHFKVALQTHANPATGQLTTTTTGTPQAPFSELKIHLNGGPRAPLDNPAVCGPAVTSADFTPWSAPGVTPEGLSVPGTPDATSSNKFDVGGCAASPGLSPGFSAGTVSPQAGVFSPFTLNLSRQDREQFLSGVQVRTPAGLLGMLSSVALCNEPQAQAGTCPDASRIGSTRVASGAGSHPFEIGGSVYLTTGYRGAPFGLSIVTNAVAGPFNLGLVVVRARIDVDPVTSALTVTSDPLPQIIFGVPLRLQRVAVNIDRPGFMFNPTSCRAQQVGATISGAGQALANLASPFAAGGCKSLDFKPAFAVSVSGHTSRVNGASLDAKVTYPPFKAGSEANIAYVKVELPRQLPSRLTTLQKACLAATFNANPASCPPQSVIGVVRASTPVLPVPLTGPVYFVSHGGEAFPSLVAVLQGDGVRVDLTGATFIDKHGITSSTFKTVPDVPVSSFELYLPQGPYSALAANTDLCALSTTSAHTVARRIHGHLVRKTVATTKAAGLSMPTQFTAQDGAAIRVSTPVTVTGCTTPRATGARRVHTATRRTGRTNRKGRR